MSRAEARRDAGVLYRELGPAVLGYLRGQHVAEPEDVLGEVFVQVARDIKKVRGDDLAVRRWVFTLARHRVVDEARRRARRPVTVTNVTSDVEAPELADNSLDPALVRALGRLTPEQREVVLLRFVADLPLEVVSKMTRRSVGAVKALQHRALGRLAKAVSPERAQTL
jgi:RNA polymerase sigma-70 factor, ECF subfamily